MISIQLSVVVLLLGFVGGGAGYTLGGSRSKGSRIELHNLPLFQHRPSGHPTQTAVVKNGQGKMENEEGNAYVKVRRSESAYDYGTVLACLPPSFLPSVHVSFHFLLFLFLSICARPFLNICRFTFLALRISILSAWLCQHRVSHILPGSPLDAFWCCRRYVWRRFLGHQMLCLQMAKT